VLRSSPATRSADPSMLADDPVARRELLSKVLGASALIGAAAANAEVDYAGVGYLGGASIIDVNNANIRVYQKLPGMYPNAAGKIVSNAPYKSKEELYTKAKLSGPEAAAVKKYEAKFIFLEPRPEYIIDNINNGLYR
jgi:photosystem II PsbU protein